MHALQRICSKHAAASQPPLAAKTPCNPGDAPTHCPLSCGAQVEHEPSVPGLTVLLMSCLLYGTAAQCQAQLIPRVGPKLSTFLQGAAGTGSIVFDFLVRTTPALMSAPCVLCQSLF